MVAVATLVGLLQRQNWLLVDVDIVRSSGEIVLCAAGGVLRPVDKQLGAGLGCGFSLFSMYALPG